MKIWKSIINRFRKEKKSPYSFSEGFNDTQKQEILEDAITTCSKILVSTMVLTNSHNYLEGKVIFPNGETWKLEFKKQEKP